MNQPFRRDRHHIVTFLTMLAVVHMTACILGVWYVDASCFRDHALAPCRWGAVGTGYDAAL